MSEQSVLNAFNYANANAGGFVTLAKGALAEAQAAVKDVGYDDVEWAGIVPIPAPSIGTQPAAPVLSPVSLNLPDAPGKAPTLQTLPDLSLGEAPTLAAEAPTLSFPSTPSAIGAAPDAPEIDMSIRFPDPPAVLTNELPPPPKSTERAEPTAPEINLPTFGYSAPRDAPDAPEDGLDIMEDTFAAKSGDMQANADAYVSAWMQKYNPEHSNQMGRIEERLSELMAGGSGFKPEIEQAIYNRARERNDVDAARVREAGYAEAASRGFTLPTGALIAGVARARQEAANAVTKANQDIIVMAAELEQKNLQFTLTTAIGLRTAMVSAAMSYMGHVTSINAQAADYAKAAFSNVVELYNASVRVYSARIDAYRAHAAVFETMLKTETTKLDVYRGEIAALEAMTNVDQSRAAVYRIQIEAITSMITLYRAQIEAAQGRASLEKLKLEVFQSQTQAFGAQVQAKNAEWSGYNAALNGEEAKVRIFGTQVSAFNSLLDSHRSTIAAKIAELDAVTKSNQAASDMHGADIRSYTALVGAESERARAENDNNRQLLAVFDKEISAFQSQAQIKLAQYTTESDVRVKNATSDLSAQIEMARARTQFGEAIANLSNDGAQIYGNLAGAAMAGINTLAADVNNT